MATLDPAVVGVQAVLVRLRTHAGLTVDRLRTTEVDTSVLTALPAVQREIDAGTGQETAIVRVIAAFARELPPTEMLIADATLALGVVRDIAGEQQGMHLLYADDLAQRREALVDQWDALHALLDTEPPRQPTVRALRGTIEVTALSALATQCVSGTAPIPAQRAGSATNSVAIVGAAVMDHICVVDHIPTANTSAVALSFDEYPGGKGLNLAVGVSQMGLEARLISAVGDDANGRTVLDYMRSQDLRTDLVKEVHGARTPVTTVLVTEAGDSAGIGWRNTTQVNRDRSEMRSLRPVLQDARAVLVTFEPSFEEVKWALKTTAMREPKPLLLVQPSPPIESPQRLYQYLSSVDYLVGSEWELRSLLPAMKAGQEFDEVARRLLNNGVKTVCAVEQLNCRIRAQGITVDVQAPAVAMNEAPAAREAFSAALIYRLLEIGRDLNDETLRWAAAAMTANISLEEIPESMPGPEDVDSLLQTNSTLE